MSQKPLAMEQLKQIIQLRQDGIKIREIVRRTGISRNTVRKYLDLINSNHLSDEQNAANVYANDQYEHNLQRYEQLIQHSEQSSSELTKTGITRLLLWKEYLNKYPGGYLYSQYCYHLQQYQKQDDLSMYLEYAPGDMIMIDFPGKKQSYIDQVTGEEITCEIFIAILPYSGLIFCKAVNSQQTVDFIDCINSMLIYYAGAPATIVCDNCL